MVVTSLARRPLVLICLQDPLLDTSVLDELRDCLSDDLWASPDMQLLTGSDSIINDNSISFL